MSVSNYFPPNPSEQPVERRRHDADPATTPRRRINDTWFNRIRWPAFVYAWFVLGFFLLVYLLFRWWLGD
jgi:hypothetical protein